VFAASRERDVSEITVCRHIVVSSWGVDHNELDNGERLVLEQLAKKLAWIISFRSARRAASLFLRPRPPNGTP